MDSHLGTGFSRQTVLATVLRMRWLTSYISRKQSQKLPDSMYRLPSPFLQHNSVFGCILFI